MKLLRTEEERRVETLKRNLLAKMEEALKEEGTVEQNWRAAGKVESWAKAYYWLNKAGEKLWPLEN